MVHSGSSIVLGLVTLEPTVSSSKEFPVLWCLGEGGPGTRGTVVKDFCVTGVQFIRGVEPGGFVL